MLKKIVAIGPESTGKSTLCAQLAQHYDALWCPEYAREYLSTHGKNYSYDDLLIIAHEQVKLEEKYIQLTGSKREKSNKNTVHSPFTSHGSLLFIDTNMFVMKVWCEFVFGKCHQFILDQIETRKYDLYLLCGVDLKWTRDQLREYPDFETRQKLYQIYKDIMANQSVSWVEINGDKEQRLKKAIQAVDSLLKE